jgi:hypothetical protein
MSRKFGALSSSANPEELAASVQGAILAVSAVIVFVAGLLGVPLAESEIAELASQAGIAVGALATLFGLIRKIVVRFAQR